MCVCASAHVICAQGEDMSVCMCMPVDGRMEERGVCLC